MRLVEYEVYERPRPTWGWKLHGYADTLRGARGIARRVRDAGSQARVVRVERTVVR